MTTATQILVYMELVQTLVVDMSVLATLDIQGNLVVSIAGFKINIVMHENYLIFYCIPLQII